MPPDSESSGPYPQSDAGLAPGHSAAQITKVFADSVIVLPQIFCCPQYLGLPELAVSVLLQHLQFLVLLFGFFQLMLQVCVLSGTFLQLEWDDTKVNIFPVLFHQKAVKILHCGFLASFVSQRSETVRSTCSSVRDSLSWRSAACCSRSFNFSPDSCLCSFKRPSTSPSCRSVSSSLACSWKETDYFEFI